MFTAESVTFYMLNWHSVNFSTGYSLISLSLHLFLHFPPLPLSILPHPPFNFSPHHNLPFYSPEQDEMTKNHNRSQGYRGRTLGSNPDKSLKSFPPCYSQSPRYSLVLRFIILQNHATSYSFYRVLLYTVKEKGGEPD